MNYIDQAGTAFLVAEAPSEEDRAAGGGYDNTMSFGTDVVSAMVQGRKIPLWYGQFRVTHLLSGHGFQIRQAEWLRESNEIITFSTVVGDGPGWGKLNAPLLAGISQYAAIKYSAESGARTGVWDFLERRWTTEFNDAFKVTFPANGDWSLLPSSAEAIKPALIALWNDATEDFPAFLGKTMGLKPQVSLAGEPSQGGPGSEDATTIRHPGRFVPESVDLITNFDPEVDRLQVDQASYGLRGAASFKAAKNTRKLKRFARSETDFIYDLKSGWLYFNENGPAKGFGLGGVCAIFEGVPALGASNLDFV